MVNRWKLRLKNMEYRETIRKDYRQAYNKYIKKLGSLKKIEKELVKTIKARTLFEVRNIERIECKDKNSGYYQNRTRLEHIGILGRDTDKFVSITITHKRNDKGDLRLMPLTIELPELKINSITVTKKKIEIHYVKELKKR